jgi:hypothetical protein
VERAGKQPEQSQQQEQKQEGKSFLRKLGEDIVRDVSHEFWNGAGPQGAHELAAALNTGSAFVMYPRGKHDDGPGVHGPQDVQQGQDVKQPEVSPPTPEQQQERGGRGI